MRKANADIAAKLMHAFALLGEARAGTPKTVAQLRQ